MAGGHRKAPARGGGATGARSRHVDAARSAKLAHTGKASKAMRPHMVRLCALGVSIEHTRHVAPVVWGAVR